MGIIPNLKGFPHPIFSGSLIFGDGAIDSWDGGILIHVDGATVQWG